MNKRFLDAIAKAIKEGKFFHLFIINDECSYLESYHHEVVAKQMKNLKDAKIIYLGR